MPRVKKDAPVQTEETVFEDVHKEEVEVAEIETSKEESIPLSIVQKMMSELEEKFFKKMKAIEASSRMSEIDEDLEYISSLEEDWLEQPVVFFAFSMNFSIHGDKKRGEESTPPNGAIKFRPLIRTKRKSGKSVQVVSVSSVKVQSRSEVEYLRSHSQYGIAFYENMGSAMNVDSAWAQKMVEAQQSINRLSDMQMIARAKQEGISVSQSPESMRRELVELIAKRSIEQHDRMLYGSIRSAVIDDRSGRSVIEKTIG